MDTVDGRIVVNSVDDSARTPDSDFDDWIIHMVTGGDVRGYALKIINERKGGN